VQLQKSGYWPTFLRAVSCDSETLRVKLGRSLFANRPPERAAPELLGTVRDLSLSRGWPVVTGMLGSPAMSSATTKVSHTAFSDSIHNKHISNVNGWYNQIKRRGILANKTPISHDLIWSNLAQPYLSSLLQPNLTNFNLNSSQNILPPVKQVVSRPCNHNPTQPVQQAVENHLGKVWQLLLLILQKYQQSKMYWPLQFFTTSVTLERNEIRRKSY